MAAVEAGGLHGGGKGPRILNPFEQRPRVSSAGLHRPCWRNKAWWAGEKTKLFAVKQ